LILGNPKVTVNIDQMGKSKLPAKSVRATEGFGSKCGQMIDMLGLARPKEWLE